MSRSSSLWAHWGLCELGVHQRNPIAREYEVSWREPRWPFVLLDAKRKNRSLPMTATITAFERSPDRGKGLARDMRVRWALEEVGQPYDVRLVSFSAMKQPAHLALHPFGQIPTYEEGDLVLFESGAIVFHIAQRHAGLLPDEANARARAITWMFAALNTVEPPILDLQNTKFLERDKTCYARLREGRKSTGLSAQPTSIAALRLRFLQLPDHPR